MKLFGVLDVQALDWLRKVYSGSVWCYILHSFVRGCVQLGWLCVYYGTVVPQTHIKQGSTRDMRSRPLPAPLCIITGDLWLSFDMLNTSVRGKSAVSDLFHSHTQSLFFPFSLSDFFFFLGWTSLVLSRSPCGCFAWLSFAHSAGSYANAKKDILLL